MMRPKLAIWGASGHALVVVDILRLCGHYEITGLIDDINPQRQGTQFDGLRILGGVEQLGALRRSGTTHIIIAVGDCRVRLRLAAIARENGYELASAIHPRATIATNAKISPGTVIAAGAVVNPCASVGENVIINTSATVDHECTIENGVHLSPGVHLGGLVSVGECTWIGIGATIRDRIRIGAYSIVGAGAVITKNIPAGVVAYGVPGKVVRNVVPPEQLEKP